MRSRERKFFDCERIKMKANLSLSPSPSPKYLGRCHGISCRSIKFENEQQEYSGSYHREHHRILSMRFFSMRFLENDERTEELVWKTHPRATHFTHVHSLHSYVPSDTMHSRSSVFLFERYIPRDSSVFSDRRLLEFFIEEFRNEEKDTIEKSLYFCGREKRVSVKRAASRDQP